MNTKLLIVALLFSSISIQSIAQNFWNSIDNNIYYNIGNLSVRTISRR